MNDGLETDLRDYYSSLTPADSACAADRVSTSIAAARVRRRGFGLPLHRPALRALALAGTLAIVAVLVAVPLLRPIPGPAASPSATASAQPTASPTPTPSASPSKWGDWKVLARAFNADASWSPDGRWLAVRAGPNNGLPFEHVQVFDRNGSLLRTLDGSDLMWLDGAQFVLERGSASFLGSIDAPNLTPITPPIAVGDSNGHGAIALTDFGQVGDTPDLSTATFKVWTATAMSAPMPGAVVAWSPNGTRLAVFHYVRPTEPQGIGPQGGWIEVVSWPGLKQVASFGQTSSDYYAINVAFDASGRYLAATGSVLDTETGQVAGHFPGVGDVVWYQGQLLVPIGNGSVLGYSIAGTRTVGQTYSGDGVNSSADGSAAVTYFQLPNQGPITLLRNGTARTIAVPGSVGRAILSADDSGVVVVCDVDDSREVLLLAD